ncbi:MAG: type II toxin-antitoxin system HicB family antitoxin [Patescibacteria group bacterium]
MFSLAKFFGQKEIIPEVLWAFRGKLPNTLEVSLSPSQDGGYVATISNLPGCVTEGNSFVELNQMVNSAVFDYFKIPAQYIPHLASYLPPKEVLEDMERRGERISKSALVFKKA